MRLVIVDYGMGNLKSLIGVFKYLGVDSVTISNNYNVIKQSDKIFLPGVGSFSAAMKEIYRLELNKILDEVVLEDKKPIFGICLGMQILCGSSEENGMHEGLGYVKAQCTKFNTKGVKVPHVGFNQVKTNFRSKIYNGFDKENDFYFTHSYKVQSSEDIGQSICNYSEDFIASYEIGNIVGTQYHPELSQTNGLKILKNFIKKF